MRFIVFEKKKKINKCSEKIFDTKKIFSVLKKNNLKNFMEKEKKFAGFWIRHIALFIDIIILLLIWVVIWLILDLLWIYLDSTTTTWFIIWLSFDLIWFIYFAVFHFYFWQTPWKMAVWVKVVDKDFWKISHLQAFWRSFATILSALPLWLWYAWASWDQKKRTFHDMLAKTLVVEEDSISKNWVIFWNVLIFILFILSLFWIVAAFNYVISNPEILMQMDLNL